MKIEKKKKEKQAIYIYMQILKLSSLLFCAIRIRNNVISFLSKENINIFFLHIFNMKYVIILFKYFSELIMITYSMKMYTYICIFLLS